MRVVSRSAFSPAISLRRATWREAERWAAIASRSPTRVAACTGLSRASLSAETCAPRASAFGASEVTLFEKIVGFGGLASGVVCAGGAVNDGLAGAPAGIAFGVEIGVTLAGREAPVSEP